MKRASKIHKLKVARLSGTVLFTLALVLSLSLFTGWFSIVSHAESAGKIISSSGANARSSASTSSSVVASYKVNEVISIRSQIQASDGYTWYEIHVDDQKLGYIRSDLVEITDGSTPPTSTQVAPSTPAPTASGTSANVNASVNAVNPVSATVANGGTSGVRIRSDASTNSAIITTVQNGAALTVTGQANSLDRDNKTWWFVSFISNNTEVNGFIREDYVKLSEEPTPYTEPTEEPEPTEDVVVNTPEPEKPKDYEVINQDGTWRLAVYNTENQGTYDIAELLRVASGNKEAYDDMQGTIKSQKIAIVILVILLVAAIGAAGFLVFKIKDMMDSAYYNEVEKETLRRRSAQGGQRVMHNVGAEKREPGQGQRPAGARPAGAPQSQRPAGAPQGQRPAGTSQGQRPTGAPQGQRPAGAPQGQRPAEADQGAGKTKPKNFMADDDEFELEFLNYDGDEKQ